jgi:alpha-D-ribose 1-methylphosphonate 5-triphosphate synthase subunit PhnH
MRAERTAYPLGWDLVIVDAARVLGLARTTTIEVIPWAT